MRSWQPRRPSAALKRRLFSAPANAAPELTRFFGWLAPVAACALLTLSMLNSGNGISENLSNHEPMTAMILSNQNYAAYASENFRPRQNNLSSVTFDWTNHGGLPSSMASFSRGKMN
ncbi:MAG: hypothetical protein ACREFE_00400 [Limisphaerales bacterium]